MNETTLPVQNKYPMTNVFAYVYSASSMDGVLFFRNIVSDDLSIGSVEGYEPFGKPLDGGMFGSPFMFTGEPLDANGLVYLRARYYAPELGMFPSLDPVEGTNRYQYANSNPVRFTDPSGLQSDETTQTIGAACLTLVGIDAALPFGDALCVGAVIALLLSGVPCHNSMDRSRV
jgi:RHS repeat-associated protein